jgi:type IV pilus assembly protein PilW
VSAQLKPACQQGLTLLELLVAMFLTSILLLGLVKLVTAASAATRLQDNQALLQDQARVALRLLTPAVSQAGYSPAPWNPTYLIEAIAGGTADGVSSHGDRLVLRGWSDRNCFDNRNPETGGDGKPLFYLREQAFDLNSTGHLARSCRYGPTEASLVTQVSRQGLVPGVESFQLLFGEDSDADGNVDRWVRAGNWTDEKQLLGVRAGLLLAGLDPVTEPRSLTYQLLDTSRRPRADGKLRQAFDMTLAIRGRNG